MFNEEREGERYRQAGRQTDRQTGRQANRQADNLKAVLRFYKLDKFTSFVSFKIVIIEKKGRS